LSLSKYHGTQAYLAIDTWDCRSFTHCTKANVSDDQGLVESRILTTFVPTRQQLKITILLDHGYHPDKLIEALQQVYPQIMTKIRFELHLSTKAEKVPKESTGFVPVATLVE